MRSKFLHYETICYIIMTKPYICNPRFYVQAFFLWKEEPKLLQGNLTFGVSYMWVINVFPQCRIVLIN